MNREEPSAFGTKKIREMNWPSQGSQAATAPIRISVLISERRAVVSAGDQSGVDGIYVCEGVEWKGITRPLTMDRTEWSFVIVLHSSMKVWSSPAYNCVLTVATDGATLCSSRSGVFRIVSTMELFAPVGFDGWISLSGRVVPLRGCATGDTERGPCSLNVVRPGGVGRQVEDEVSSPEFSSKL